MTQEIDEKWILNKTYPLTPLKHLKDENRKVALAWKYKKFRLSAENNKYDKNACRVEKWNNKEWISVGYVQRFNYETIFTPKADELYQEALVMNNWDDMMGHENWADIEDVVKTEFVSPEEIELLIEYQSKFKILSDKESYDGWRLFLEKR